MHVYNYKRFTFAAFYFVLIFVLNTNIYAQTPILDSLKNRIKYCETNEDSIQTYKQLVFRSWPIDGRECLKYGLLAFETAKHTTDSGSIAWANYALGIAYRTNGKIMLAERYCNNAFNIAIKAKKSLCVSWSGFDLLDMEITQGNTEGYKFYLKTCRDHLIDISKETELRNNGNPNNNSIEARIKSVLKHIQSIEFEYAKPPYYFYLANLYNMVNNREDAMLCVQKAMNLAEKSKSEVEILKAYYQIAYYFSEFHHNYPLALNYYQKITESQLSDRTINMYGDVFLEIGNTYRLMGKDSLSLVYIQRGLKRSKCMNSHVSMAMAYLTLGDLYYQNADYAKAKQYYLKSYEAGSKSDLPVSVHNALIKLGDICLLESNPGKARFYYDKGLSLAVSFSDYKSQIISMQAFASLFEAKGEINQAIDYNKKAFQLSQRINYLEGQSYNAEKISFYYNQSGNYRKAYEYSNIARQLSDSINKINQADNLANLVTYFDFKNLQNQKLQEKINSDKEIARQKLTRNLVLILLVFISFTGLVIFIAYRRKKKDNIVLNEQKQAIEKLSEELHKADVLKTRFVTDISHELRTPLTLMLTPLKRILNNGTNGETENLSKIILRNADILKSLIDQLLDISKIDQDKLKLNFATHDFNKVFKVSASMFESLADDKHITFKILSDDNSIMCSFDHKRIEQLIHNLLSNAFKFTPENGTIIIQLSRHEKILRLLVKDTGIGIPPGDLNKIFNRFYKSELNHKNNHEGSGLGLAIVKEYVELHQGSINVKSEPGKGTEFIIDLPVINSENNEKDHKDNFNPVSKEIPVTGKEYSSGNNTEKYNETILIIEDNKDLRTYLTGLLASEYNVVESVNGAEGLECAVKHIPDIIISDIMMPKMDGYQVISKIKNDIKTCHIPVILLTAKTAQSSKLEGLRTGADDYLGKPFDEAELLLRIQNILNNRKRLQEKHKLYFLTDISKAGAQSKDEVFITKLVKIIEDNISGPVLDVEFLSSQAGLSRQQLYRKLKALINRTPNEFIRDIRLKKAAHMLKQNTATVSEVAYMTGFDNLSYFTRKFKEEYKILPSEYNK